MELSYILIAAAITIAATIPYKLFSNWRREKIVKNLQKIAKEFNLTFEQPDDSKELTATIHGTIDNTAIRMETTWTTENIHFPVTHITVKKISAGNDKVMAVKSSYQKITIIPNRTFMDSPDEQYISTGDRQLDALYLTGINRLKPPDPDMKGKSSFESNSEHGDTNNETSTTFPKKEITDVSTVPRPENLTLSPELLNLLKNGISVKLYEGQLIIENNLVRYSISSHIDSSALIQRVNFILQTVPTLLQNSSNHIRTAL